MNQEGSLINKARLKNNKNQAYDQKTEERVYESLAGTYQKLAFSNESNKRHSLNDHENVERSLIKSQLPSRTYS